MIGIHDFGVFLAAGVLLNLTPGQDTLYILGRSIAHGRTIGIASALGVSAGCLFHTLAAAFGLSAILATSSWAFFALKLLGAAYLVYLGVRTFCTPVAAPDVGRSRDAVTSGAAFWQGALTNVTNPKVGLFFLALLPQFIEADSPNKVAAFLLLGLTFVATGTIWCLVLAVSAARMRDLFAPGSRASVLLARTAGGLFIVLGIRLAASEPMSR
jgi:threonine/homoserine/homoserine lactone efflux protein